MLFNDDIVLRMENVSKCYEIYSKPIDRLKQILLGKRSKYYKEFWALRDINFEVHRGECVGVIGKNGAGKSTVIDALQVVLLGETSSRNFNQAANENPSAPWTATCEQIWMTTIHIPERGRISPASSPVNFRTTQRGIIL